MAGRIVAPAGCDWDGLIPTAARPAPGLTAGGAWGDEDDESEAGAPPGLGINTPGPVADTAINPR